MAIPLRSGIWPRGVVFAVSVLSVMLSASRDAGAGQRATAPRLRDAHLAAQMPEAVGGGEAVLELTVDSRGAVTHIDAIRVTPPYTDFVADSAAEWQFEPATIVSEGRPVGIDARVLIVAVFRPPTFYSGAGQRVPPETRGTPSVGLPRLQSLVMPVYPPTATGNGVVLVEIEVSARAESHAYRIVGPASGFDAAGIDAVRAWRFAAPQAVDAPDHLFVYAVVGFRAPLAPATPQRK